MNARDNGENWVVIGPSHVELGPQVPAMVGNQLLTLGDYHCFLTMIPIDCKITNFCAYWFVCHNCFLTCQLLISGKSVSQYSSYLPIFNPLHNVISKEQHEKYLYNQCSHYTKYKMFDRQNLCPSQQFKSGCVA